MRIILPAILALAMAAAPAAWARSDKANPGGQSASHMSAQGLANTNGPNAANRQKGLGRAEQRMSEQGLAHSKARAHAKNTHTTKSKSRNNVS